MDLGKANDFLEYIPKDGLIWTPLANKIDNDLNGEYMISVNLIDEKGMKAKYPVSITVECELDKPVITEKEIP